LAFAARWSRAALTSDSTLASASVSLAKASAAADLPGEFRTA
jgi:hypothetical protein